MDKRQVVLILGLFVGLLILAGVLIRQSINFYEGAALHDYVEHQELTGWIFDMLWFASALQTFFLAGCLVGILYIILRITYFGGSISIVTEEAEEEEEEEEEEEDGEDNVEFEEEEEPTRRRQVISETEIATSARVVKKPKKQILKRPPEKKKEKKKKEKKKKEKKRKSKKGDPAHGTEQEWKHLYETAKKA